MQCTVETCHNKVRAWQMCNKHYLRLKRHGDTNARQKQEQHGLRQSPEYNSWRGMKDRCYRPNHKAYKDYGGRGIQICERWLTSFKSFYEDMGARPSPRHSIDRIDVNGNYEPSNCKWSTRNEQAVNVQNRQLGTVPGVSYRKNQNRWFARLEVNKQLVLSKGFINFEDAVAARKTAEIKWLGYSIEQ